MSKSTDKPNIIKHPIARNRFINIYFSGLFAIFFDQEHNRAMIGMLDERKHETQFLINDQPLKINDKNFTENQKRWQVKLYLQSQKPLSISRGGTVENGDAFDYFVDIEKLEGCGDKETLPLRQEFFKGRFYLNAGEFKADKKAFKDSVVDFVRQDSRMPLSTWRPRPIAESLQITIPLIGVESAELQIGNQVDFISVPLNIKNDIKINIKNDCTDGGASGNVRDTDFVAFYKLIADNRTPAVPVNISSLYSLQSPSSIQSPNLAKKELVRNDPSTGNAAPHPDQLLEAMCGGVLFGNTKSF
ncbi:MAG: hypothetical protein HY819_11110 [Acidobacteria bacterium]|nr:hypothetical protein [Acidobacteriota bacterium]